MVTAKPANDLQNKYTSLVCGRNRSGRRMTEHQEASFIQPFLSPTFCIAYATRVIIGQINHFCYLLPYLLILISNTNHSGQRGTGRRFA